MTQTPTTQSVATVVIALQGGALHVQCASADVRILLVDYDQEANGQDPSGSPAYLQGHLALADPERTGQYEQLITALKAEQEEKAPSVVVHAVLYASCDPEHPGDLDADEPLFFRDAAAAQRSASHFEQDQKEDDEGDGEEEDGGEVITQAVRVEQLTLTPQQAAEGGYWVLYAALAKFDEGVYLGDLTLHDDWADALEAARDRLSENADIDAGRPQDNGEGEAGLRASSAFDLTLDLQEGTQTLSLNHEEEGNHYHVQVGRFEPGDLKEA